MQTLNGGNNKEESGMYDK